MTTKGRTARYLIADYHDVRDVVLTIEQWISETATGENRSALRECCGISIHPLSGGSAFILNVHVPQEMLAQTEMPALRS